MKRQQIGGCFCVRVVGKEQELTGASLGCLRCRFRQRVIAWRTQ